MNKPKILVIGSNSFSGSHFVDNFQVGVEEQDAKLVFMHKVVPSGANRSSGIKATELPSVPDNVMKRSRDLK